MRIGVDASRANTQHRTGVEWYAYHLLRELAQLPESARHTWLTYAPQPLMPDLARVLQGWDQQTLAWPPKYGWTQFRLSFEMSQQPPELLFIPAHTLPRILPKKTVVTVHDVAFRRHPELYPAHQVAWHEITTRDIAQSTAHVLTVSAFCKQELQELYRIPEDRVTVTPLGVDASYVPASIAEQERARTAHSLGSAPFFLYVGRLEKKKNTQRLVEAFLLLAEQEAESLCVLVGTPGFGWNDIRSLIDRHPQGHRVRVLGYVAEAEKRALLSAAQAYVQPSLYEGFGLPVLEAMACGTLVVSSSAGSLPEVGAGGGAFFVDPHSAESIAAGMAEIQRLSEADRSPLVARGKAHAPSFTWQETAKKTLAAFERYV